MRKLLTGRRVIFASVLIAAIAWAAVAQLPDSLAERRLRVWFLDVGQGDAILIQTPDGRQILVDGGPSPSALAAELGDTLPFWDRSLDLVIMTHPDADHAAGLIPLFERFSIRAAMDALPPGDPAGAAWTDALRTAGAQRESATRGTKIRMGKTEMTVLHPGASAATEAGNNESIVLRLEYGATSLLLTGDAEMEAERSMLTAAMPLRAEILKVGHHGSNASASAEFLAAVQPRLAVISVGADNRFGHPAPELLTRLQGIEVLRTDQSGRIELVSDGQRWKVLPERSFARNDP